MDPVWFSNYSLNLISAHTMQLLPDFLPSGNTQPSSHLTWNSDIASSLSTSDSGFESRRDSTLSAHTSTSKALSFSIETLLRDQYPTRPSPSSSPTLAPLQSTPIRCSLTHDPIWTIITENTSSPLDLSKPQPSESQIPAKTLSCRFCNKIYSSRSSCRLHEATHTMPFKCADCGRRFSRPWLVESHRRIHTGEKPYTCPLCARKFADRSNMRVHARTHRPPPPRQQSSALAS